MSEEKTQLMPTPLFSVPKVYDFNFTHTPFEVELIDKLGTDLTVVNSARISFGTTHTTLTPGDQKLIGFLAREKHYSPFRHCMLQLRIKAPEFVMRQAYKHQIGCEWTEGSKGQFKDSAWNEMSGRYKQYKDIYVPPVWKQQHATAKQCSAGDHPDQEEMKALYMKGVEANLDTYKQLIERGVSKEQARMCLPLTFMTEVVWTASLQAIQNFVALRDSPHAQGEIQLMAQEIRKIAEREFPVAFRALMDTSEGKNMH